MKRFNQKVYDQNKFLAMKKKKNISYCTNAIRGIYKVTFNLVGKCESLCSSSSCESGIRTRKGLENRG